MADWLDKLSLEPEPVPEKEAEAETGALPEEPARSSPGSSPGEEPATSLDALMSRFQKAFDYTPAAAPRPSSPESGAPAAPARGASAIPASGSSPAPHAPRAPAPPPRPRPRAGTSRTPAEASPRRAFRRQSVLACTTVVLAGLAFMNCISTERTADVLSASQRRQLGGALETAYRDERAGGLFVGNLGATWDSLSEVDRYRAAHELLSRVDRDGTREVMIYDAQHRLVVHASAGRLIVPETPEPVRDLR